MNGSTEKSTGKCFPMFANHEKIFDILCDISIKLWKIGVFRKHKN